MDDMKLFSGRAHPELAKKVCDYLGLPPGRAIMGNFPDGEISCKIDEDVRGRDVFIVQPTCPPVNETLMELLIMIESIKRASAERITAVIPYFGYARQDRKDEGRVPITAKLVANLITRAGADRVLAMDLHAGQIQGFFNIPFDHLYSMPVLVEHLRARINPAETVFVSPDAGGVERTRAYSKRLPGTTIAMIDKRRTAANVSEVMHIIGDVAGRECIIVDDIVDSAGTLCNTAVALMEAGAKSVSAYITHGVLSGGAVSRVASSPIQSLVITDSIQGTEAVRVSQNIRQLTISPLLGEAMRRISEERSVSSLFDYSAA